MVLLGRDHQGSPSFYGHMFAYAFLARYQNSYVNESLHETLYPYWVVFWIMDDISLLKKQIEQISILDLIHKDKDSGEFKAWHAGVLRILDRLFKTNSREYKDFSSIQFYNPTALFSEYEYRRGIQQAKVTLEGYIEQLEGIEPTQSDSLPSMISKKEDEKLNITSPKSENVFIVHGHDDVPKLELERMLSHDFGLNPIILHRQVDQGRTLIEKLEANTEDIGYAFIILTADDVGMEKEIYDNPRKYPGQGLNLRARQNVILELGYFIGKIKRRNVCCIHKDNIEIPNDVLGIAYKKYHEHITELYKEIRDELEASGYKIN